MSGWSSDVCSSDLRWRAIGDALRQAIASGGMDMRAATLIDRNVIRSDVMWATAQARVTGYRLTDEWREAGLMKVSISATIAPIDAPSCGAAPLPRPDAARGGKWCCSTG